MHGLDNSAWFFVVGWKGGFGVSIAWNAIVGLDRGVFVRYRIVWGREIVRLLRQVYGFLK